MGELYIRQLRYDFLAPMFSHTQCSTVEYSTYTEPRHTGVIREWKLAKHFYQGEIAWKNAENYKMFSLPSSNSQAARLGH